MSKMSSQKVNVIVFIVAVALSGLALSINGQDTRQNPNTTSTDKTTPTIIQITNSSTTIKANVSTSAKTTRKPSQKKIAPTKLTYLNSSQIPCDEELTVAINICTKPLMNIIEGNLLVWPRTQKDAADLCQSLAGAEKCVREVGRRCAKGFQKTLFQTFSNSVQRARKQECTKEKYDNILKMTKCAEKNQSLMRNLIANITHKLDFINYKIEHPSDKITGLCCLVYSIEKDIKSLLGPKCPNEAETVVRLYRAILEDVLELLCRESKRCDEVFKNYKYVTRKFAGGTLISSVMKTVTFLGAD